MWDDDIENFNPDSIKTGFCIRTKNVINYNTKTPIERNEYLSNYDRSGKFCHQCGKKYGTNLSEPLCHDCKWKIPNTTLKQIKHTHMRKNMI